jgi:hypothetical protein
MITRLAFLFVIVTFSVNMFSFEPLDTISTKANSKSGWSFGAVPVIAFDSDIGFKYGGLVNFYHYGDGSIYPDYKHSIYLEWSRTTKGSGINQVTYDSKYLIPKVRVSAEISYLTEKTLDFYGFNGYKALYDHKFEDDSPENSDNYKSRVFFRQDRKLLRIRNDFQGDLFSPYLKWVAGITHYSIQLDTVDIHNLNRGKKEDELLPSTGGGLFGLYKEWKVLPLEEYDGGSSTLLKLGFFIDTRDNEPNPMHGVWSGISIFIDPGFLGESNPYGRFSLTHRRYYTLISEKLSFVYRVIYQGKLFGDIPSYMAPFLHNSGRYTDRDAFGGSKTLRGILRNRLVGNDILLGNFEFRWKFFQRVVLNQNVYMALSAFTDLGKITRDFKLEESPLINPDYFPDVKDRLHQSVGAGYHIALNDNFIVAADYGVALNKKDGNTGLYIGLNWLF